MHFKKGLPCGIYKILNNCVSYSDVIKIFQEKDKCSAERCLLRGIQGVQEKVCVFTIHCNPSLAYIAEGDLQSSQRNASVQSLLLAGYYLYNQ